MFVIKLWLDLHRKLIESSHKYFSFFTNANNNDYCVKHQLCEQNSAYTFSTHASLLPIEFRTLFKHCTVC